MLRLRAGDEYGFGYLLDKYRTPVVHFLYRMVHQQAVAEELAQEVFLRVYRARKSYRPTAKFTTWLFRIATNVALNALRDGRMRWLREVSAEEESASPQLAQFADPLPTAEQSMLEEERCRKIRQAVDGLPEKQRLAVLLHKYQELDYAEIAGILGCSESALKSLLFRAYETLRVKLRPLLGARS
jgi:RNA polymerase sigma-70 factor (ECF subfamily)